MNDIIFLLRHLGQQTEQQIGDSLGRDPKPDLAALKDAGRIEPAGPRTWRLIPAKP